MTKKTYNIKKARAVITNDTIDSRYTLPLTNDCLGRTDDIEAKRKTIKHKIEQSDMYNKGDNISIYFTYDEVTV